MAEKRATIAPIDDTGNDGLFDELIDPNDPGTTSDPLLNVIIHLYNTVNTLITHTNTTNGRVDQIDISSDIDLDDLKSNVTANTAKTGITTSQANAITANTAQTGITTTQATTITANKNLVAALDIMRFQNVPEAGLNSKNKMDISCTWGINKTTSKLELTMTAFPAGGASGTRYSSVIATLDPVKKGK